MTVVDEIAAERKRQIEVEGWTPQHDDREHERGHLALAAASYALHAGDRARRGVGYFSPPPNIWPFDEEWWKPKDQRRDLIRAAALIVAEIERLDRNKLPVSRKKDMSTDPELVLSIKAKAFKAGARWCSKNGADHWNRLDQDAKHYAETSKEVDRGGFVAVRSGHVDEQ